MIEAPIALAFTAGMVATVNPCGFPMLPAYLSYFIGSDHSEAESQGGVPRALLAGSAVSSGFLLVFLVLGLPINAGVDSIYRFIPWASIAIGVAMILLGLAMLQGYKLKIVLPRLDQGGQTRQWRSMMAFGMSYAIASLSCSLPIFLVMVLGSGERTNMLSGLIAFLAYGFGMSAVLMVLSLALALARESIVRRMRQMLQYTDRIAGVLLVLVGVYLIYYWADNLLRDPRELVGTSPISAVEDLSTSLQIWLQDGGVFLGTLFMIPVLLAIVATLYMVTRARRLRVGLVSHNGKGAIGEKDGTHAIDKRL